MSLFVFTVFLGSFLSFSLQPMVGKILLPYFGGTNTVWSTTLFFFINALLIGYIYTFFLSKQKIAKQKKGHRIAIFLSLFFFTLTFFTNKQIFPQDLEKVTELTSIPSLQIILLLSSNLLFPYFLLSTTSTLLQSWYTKIKNNKSPYHLYSISNAGSLIGLASYPFLIEPNLTLASQQKLWGSLFILYTLLYFQSSRFKSSKITKTTTSPLNRTAFFSWVFLSAFSNFVLISTTSTITQSVTPSPFFWVIPLALFLISFILGFSSKFYQRQYHAGLLAFSVFIVLSSLNNFFDFKLYWATTAFIIFYQFIVSLVCHSELFRIKPKDEHITSFYLAIAIGGSVGATLGAIIAPNFFKDTWELPLSLGLSSLLYFVIFFVSSKSIQQKAMHFIASTFLLFLTIQYFSNPHQTLTGNHSKIVYSARNFYGAIKITKDNAPSAIHPYNKTLFNGVINHGYQTFNSADTHVATIYYAPQTGIGRYIQDELFATNPKSQRIGVIGLGVGALAGYCQKGSYFRFYEINPLVIQISQEQFTFLKNCQNQGGSVDIIAGDARVSLQKELAEQKKQQFDLLVVDAFTDDAIPTHLLTIEAIDLFFEHLKEGGVLAYHISNRHLKLEDVLFAASAKQNHFNKYINTNDSAWFFISKSSKNNFEFHRSTPSQSKLTPWTDDYSNILTIIR